MKNVDDDYETTVAHMRESAAVRGGYVYESGTGHCVWSSEPMSTDELVAHWSYIEAHSGEYEDSYSDEYDHEPYYTLGEPRMNWSY